MKRCPTSIILSVLMIFFSTVALQAKDDSGHNILFFGDSAASLGRGGTGVAYYGSDIFYINPSSIAASERMEFGIQYGTLNLRYNNPSLSFAMPTTYGVMGVSFRMINIPSDSLDIESGYMFGIGGAKEFTKRLMMGASLNFFKGADPVDSLYYGGISIGSMYRLDFSKKFRKGFMISEPLIGASISAGLPGGENKDLADFNQVTLGYSLLFYSGTDFDLRFFNDASAINKYEDFPVKFGLESVIMGNYIARAGCTVPQSYEYGDFTAGAGYKFKVKDFDGDINYSLVYYDKTDFVHYVGLNLKYGELDRNPPAAEVESTEEYISPNYDGKKDFMFFKPRVQDESRLAGWKLQIKDQGDVVVREYKISDRDMEEDISLKHFVRKIWQKKESAVIPETILWDGIDKYRQEVPDGRYQYSFIAWDEHDNISTAKTGMINVDRTSPAADAASDILFSPNGDNQKDSLDVKLNITTSPEDEWKAYFYNSRGDPVRSFKWKGADVPKSAVWDGKDDNGKDVPEGVYSFSIVAVDRAGNSASLTKKGITLTREYEVADITASLEYFSYKNQKEINFFLNLSKTAGLQEWKIAVEDSDGDIVREIKGGADLQKFVNFDMKDFKGDNLDDGKYFFKLTTKFDSGNTPSSFKKELIVDSTSPAVSVDYSPDLFSPDDDGENDILTIYPSAKDNTALKNWSMVIYAPSGEPFKSYSGTGNPAGEIKWDGIGKDKDLVESAADYFIELSATDVAGNGSRTGRVKLPVDVLVVVTERGLKIRISNIEFAFDKAALTGKAFPILNRVTEILEKYGNYYVMIEGHTDDIGQEEYNLRLSESRAKSVTDYLVSKGISQDRLQFRGMGETVPFLPNTANENRRRNRRVEFLLIKEGQSGEKNK
ncbi:MAG: OmpA family protein [Spirochaetes bacterium]|nr:OmpA family protein [Spirochaetota bacterium]